MVAQMEGEGLEEIAEQQRDEVPARTMPVGIGSGGHCNSKPANDTVQVQHDSARASGVSEDQIAIFEHQADAIEAVRSGAIDAYASTALGNRILADRIGGSVLEAVEHEPGTNGKPQNLPLGAFSFNRRNSDLLNAVNGQLRLYLGSPNHRARMARFGLTHNEIDPALVR